MQIREHFSVNIVEKIEVLAFETLHPFVSQHLYFQLSRDSTPARTSCFVSACQSIWAHIRTTRFLEDR